MDHGQQTVVVNGGWVQAVPHLRHAPPKRDVPGKVRLVKEILPANDTGYRGVSSDGATFRPNTDLLLDLVEVFNQQLALGVRRPLQWDHSDGPGAERPYHTAATNVIEYISDLWIEYDYPQVGGGTADTLFAAVYVSPEILRELTDTTRYTSATVAWSVQESQHNWPVTLTHIAIVDQPGSQAQRPFVAMSGKPSMFNPFKKKPKSTVKAKATPPDDDDDDEVDVTEDDQDQDDPSTQLDGGGDMRSKLNELLGLVAPGMSVPDSIPDAAAIDVALMFAKSAGVGSGGLVPTASLSGTMVSRDGLDREIAELNGRIVAMCNQLEMAADLDDDLDDDQSAYMDALDELDLDDDERDELIEAGAESGWDLAALEDDGLGDSVSMASRLSGFQSPQDAGGSTAESVEYFANRMKNFIPGGGVSSV